MENWRSDNSNPVKMARIPYTPVSLLNTSIREINSAPVWRLMIPSTDYFGADQLRCHIRAEPARRKLTFGRGSRTLNDDPIVVGVRVVRCASEEYKSRNKAALTRRKLALLSNAKAVCLGREISLLGLPKPIASCGCKARLVLYAA